MIKKLLRLKKHHQLGFSLIMLSGIICFWRGAWGILDMYFIPHDPALSYCLSFVLGVGIVVVTHYTVDKIV